MEPRVGRLTIFSNGLIIADDTLTELGKKTVDRILDSLDEEERTYEVIKEVLRYAETELCSRTYEAVKIFTNTDAGPHIKSQDAEEKGPDKDQIENVKHVLRNTFTKEGYECWEDKDAQVISDVIEILKRKNITISHATSILRDTIKVIPEVEIL